MKGGECKNYLVNPNECSNSFIKRDDCNDYFYLDNESNKFKKCRKSASKSKKCRNPFYDSEPRTGTSICKDQDDAKKRKEQFEKEQIEFRERARVESIRQQELREKQAKESRMEFVKYMKKSVKHINEESANRFIEHNEKDQHFINALKIYKKKNKPLDVPNNTSPPKQHSSRKSVKQKSPERERSPEPDFPENKTFGMNASDYGGSRKRKYRKSRKIRKSRKRKSKKSRKSRKSRK